MAHFAEVDGTGRVVRVIAVSNAAIRDESGVERESLGVALCKTFAATSQWVQTSYSGRIRKNFAALGYTYDSARDAFIPPKPYASWVLDDATCRWNPPIPRPSNGMYRWDERLQAWVNCS